MNRRQFLVRAAALNVPLATIGQAIASPRQASGATRFERVVADTRVPPSVAFAASMARRGTPVSVTDGDLTSLWFDDLARQFAGTGIALAGLTTARTALVMIELARGPGVRVIWRAEHRAMPDGRLRHDIRGEPSLVARATERLDGSDWSADLGSVLAEDVAPAMPPSRMASSIAHTARIDGLFDGTLSSWVLLAHGPGVN